MSAPFDPRHARYRPLSRLLGTGMVLVVALAVLTILLDRLDAGPEAGLATGVAMVLLLCAIPLVRILWLVWRWFRRGDPRFAILGVLVVAIPAVGYLLAG